jgi:lysophospholipid acyltransferase (LPLAT)-like uncharacterized protein
MAADRPAPSRSARRSGVVVPRQATWRQRVVARGVWFGLTLLGATMRFRVHDESGHFAGNRHPPQVIFALWHNRLALSLVIFRRFVLRRCPGRRLAGLVSASRDGGLLARIMELFGAVPVRGSTSRRGPQALLELVSEAGRGADLAVTPDGPRGPCYRVQAGVVAAAQLTGLAVVPVAFNYSWKVKLRSWDRFQIPLPFSRCDIRLGPAVPVPREADNAGREAARARLEAALLARTRD